MPWYDGNIPTKWKTALERKTGAKIAVKAVLDPDGINLTLDGTHDLVSAGVIAQERDTSIDYGGRATVQDVALVFNDPDNYFSPDNTASPFHQADATLSADASATDTILKLLSFTGFSFAADEVLVIGDGTNEEEVVVASFTADNGSTGYHSLVIDAPGLVSDFVAGTRIWTAPVVGKEIVISLVNLTESTAEELTVFRGRIIRAPELSLGQAKITISDTRKKQLDTVIVGADASDDLKLMTVDVDGTLVSSIDWGEQFNKPPLAYSVDEGQLPSGLLLNSTTGAITGTPTTAGSFTFTIRVTNADGDYITQEIKMMIVTKINTEFESALGLDGFEFTEDSGCKESHALTESDTLELSWLSGGESYWGNLAGWGTDDEDPIMAQITDSALQSGDLCVLARIDSTNWGDYSGSGQNYFAAIYVRRLGTGSEPGEIGGTSKDMYGYMVGYNNYDNRISCYDVVADNRFNQVNDVGTDLVFRIRKVSNVYYFAYKSPGGSWTEFVSTKSATWAPGHVGVFYGKVGDSSENNLAGSLDIDYLRYYTGSLAIVEDALPHTIVGDSYSYMLRASGGAGEYVWDVSVGSLPAGLSLDADTGVISGEPTTSGSVTFTMRVTDGAGATSTTQFTIDVGEYQILPDILPFGFEGIAYSQTMRLAVGGALDRELVTVGSRCPLGRWTFTFTSSTEFEVDSPLGKFTGSITEDFTIPSVLTIPTTAWFAGMATNDQMTFITGKTWVNENPVQIIYDILAEIAGLSPKQLHASSYFGDVIIGTVSDHDTDTEEIDIAVTLPAIIAAGEALEIGEDDVAVVTGNAEASSYPPTITLVIDESSGDLTGEVVTWKQRAAVDEAFSFDAEYAYCEAAGLRLSICLDRQMTIAQAVEAVGTHAQMFEFHSFGVEGLHSFRPRYQATVKELTDAELKEALAIEAKELANVIVVKYAYDYFSEEYQYSYTYPESNAENPSYQRHDVRIEKTIYAPGIYSADLAECLARRIYEMYENGIELLRFNVDLRGLPLRIGELVDVDIDDPVKDKRFELVGKKIQTSGTKNVELAGYNRSAFEKFAIADVALADASCAW